MFEDDGQPLRDDSTAEFKSEFVAVNHEQATTLKEALPDISQFSMLMRLLQSTAWVLQFVNVLCAKLRQKNQSLPDSIPCEELLPTEVAESENLWWQQAQADSFVNELLNLKTKKPVPATSRLSKLSTMLDDEGMLRVKGRAEKAVGLPGWDPRPVILDPKHRLTQLLIQHYHKKSQHHGQE